MDKEQLNDFTALNGWLESWKKTYGVGEKTLCEEVDDVSTMTIEAWIESSHQTCSIKKGVLKNFTKFTGKHLCQNFLFNKVAGLRQLWCFPVQVFSCEFCEFFKDTFFTEHLWTTASRSSDYQNCVEDVNQKIY